jgi:hypothetical protein
LTEVIRCAAILAGLGKAHGELERYVFEAIFKAIERMLAGWKCERDGLVEAYALKEVRISSDRLLMLTRSLSSHQKVHEITRITRLSIGTTQVGRSQICLEESSPFQNIQLGFRFRCNGLATKTSFTPK